MSSFKPVIRTPEQKRDVLASWDRPDEEFFAAGACHILCGAFLHDYSGKGFSAHLIHPAEGARGAHVVATSRSQIFDWRGFSPRDEFLQRYAEGYRDVFPNWKCRLISISNPVSREFCEQYHMRHLSQFPSDPWIRARAYLRELLGGLDAAPAQR